MMLIRKQHLFSATFYSLFLLIICLAQLGTSAPAQWYPDENTSIEYKIKAQMTLKDGKIVESNKFNVVNWSNSFYIMSPELMEIDDETGYNNFAGKYILNNTEISIVIKYSDKDLTTLVRNTILIVNGTEYSSMDNFNFILNTKESFINYIYQPAKKEYIPKNDFIYNNSIFFDYIDITKGVGEIMGHLTIIGVTDDDFILTDHYLSPLYNFSALYDRQTGRCNTFIKNYYVGDQSNKAENMSYQIYREENELEIPGFSTPLIIGLIFLTTLSLGKKFSENNRVGS